MGCIRNEISEKRKIVRARFFTAGELRFSFPAVLQGAGKKLEPQRSLRKAKIAKEELTK